VKIKYMIRIGNAEPVPFDPEARPDLVKALNEQAMRRLGYEPVKGSKKEQSVSV